MSLKDAFSSPAEQNRRVGQDLAGASSTGAEAIAPGDSSIVGHGVPAAAPAGEALAIDAMAGKTCPSSYEDCTPLSRMIDVAASSASGTLTLSPMSENHELAGLRSLRNRAAAYLSAGVPVHFRGPAGVGKTTLALDLAARLGRPVSLVTGGSEVSSEDLLGRQLGETTSEVRDRYVQRVLRTETRSRADWQDSVLAEAVEGGHTLVYDEFTRTPPEANNALLSALEERVLVFVNPARGRRYLHAHPAFRVILTSNPDEYAGVNAAPDALFDRMVTFDLGLWDAETEAAIVRSRTGLAREDTQVVVSLVRAIRAGSDAPNPPSIRTAVTIARLLNAQNVSADPRDARFVQICLDVLETRAPRGGEAERAAFRAELRRRILGCRTPGAAA